MAGIRAVDADGYFDVEVTCEGPFVKPPQSCFLDGLQVATGATMGKRTLHWVRGERIVVRVRNTNTGKTAEVQPSPDLLDLLGVLQSPAKMQDDETPKNSTKQESEEKRIEAVARKLALMGDKEILTVTFSK
jgi:formylmethanofuran dehydrogenase subunit E